MLYSIRKICLLIILFTAAQTAAQTITWTDVSSQFSLPEGVKLIKGERTSPALKCWYYDVDMNNPKIALHAYVTGSNANVPQLTKKFGAYAAVNGGFFSGSTTLSTVVYPGEVKAQNVASLTRNSMAYPVIRSFFGVKKDRSLSVDWIYHYGSTINDIYTLAAPLAYTYNDPSPKSIPAKTSGTQYKDLITGIGGAPVLVKAGKANVTYNEELMWGSGVGLSNGDPRTAVGYTAGKHVLIFVADGRSAVSSGVSLTELADIFVNLGCVEALNLDGGGSTQMSLGGSFINTPSENRAVTSILAIINPDSLHMPVEPLYEKIIDTEDPQVSLEGTGWFATANTGFYGTSKAMLNAIGDGSGYARYRLNLPQAGKYRVYGWWVASSNRAQDTPYIISYDGGTATVKKNQSQNGSAWVLIGEYNFKGDTTETVVISNKAATGSYICADAIKLSLVEPAVSVGDQKTLPAEFSLEQNYPNPFNPTTTIAFNIPEAGLVKLIIYDVLGREVMTLAEGFRDAGIYQVTVDASQLNSGVYFYRLESGRYASVKKMMLVR